MIDDLADAAKLAGRLKERHVHLSRKYYELEPGALWDIDAQMVRVVAEMRTSEWEVRQFRSNIRGLVQRS